MNKFKILGLLGGFVLPALLITVLFLSSRKPIPAPIAKVVEQKPEVLGSNSDFLAGGTASADSVDGFDAADRAVDNNNETYWNSTSTAFPHWWKYDLGDGVKKMARKIYIRSSSNQLKDWKLQGSNNDADWTDILPRSEAKGASPVAVEFENSTAYRYHRIYFTSSYLNRYNNIYEVKLFD